MTFDPKPRISKQAYTLRKRISWHAPPCKQGIRGMRTGLYTEANKGNGLYTGGHARANRTFGLVCRASTLGMTTPLHKHHDFRRLKQKRLGNAVLDKGLVHDLQ
jgi:hypothetical protein